MDTLFKIIADQAIEVERLTGDSQALKERLEKLTESNESLVKENSGLRGEVRDLKTPSSTPLPLTSALPRTPSKPDATLPLLSSEKTGVPHHEEISTPPRRKQLRTQLPQSLPSTSNTSVQANFKGRLRKLLGHWAVGKHASSKTLLSRGEKKEERHERRPLSGIPSKSSQEPPRRFTKTGSKASTVAPRGQIGLG
jgi:hypothetical protein